ncbi:MAG: hypothetical protein FJ290_23520 [Planctomycetes bacterium]|nr:hypothetical protein [Planctomycetota bacterium]
MLVLFSDTHFSDGTVDALNVPAYAFRVLQDHLAAILERPGTRVESIEVGLLGDVFDLVCSAAWQPPGPMPWDTPDAALEARVGAILDATIAANAEALGFFAQLGSALGRPTAVYYLPGNHDRAANAFASTRRRLAAALRVKHDAAKPFPTSRLWHDYGVFAEHGDRLDPVMAEVAGTVSCLSDAFTVHIMCGFVLRFREWARGHGLPDGQAWVLREVQEVDHVRPKWATADWFHGLLTRVRDERVRDGLAGAWRAAMASFQTIDPARFGVPPGAEVLRLIRHEGLGQAEAMLGNPLARKVLGDRDDAHVAAAQEALRAHSPAVRYVVHGHTHSAARVPLDMADGRPRLYFNTGTWRHTINLALSPDGQRRLLVPWEEMSFLVVYKEGESPGPAAPYGYEMWRGARG